MTHPRGKFTNSIQSIGGGDIAPLSINGTGHLLVSSGSGVVIDFTPTLDTSIYANNDVLFISTAVTGVGSIQGGLVKLTSAVCFDGDDQGTNLDVYFTTNATTPGTINGALSAADSVFDDIVAKVTFSTWNDLINSQNSIVTGQQQLIQLPAGSTDLYAFGVVRSGTPTYTAAGMKFKFGFERL